MRQHRSERFSTTMPWRVPVAVDEVSEGGERFALVADAQARDEIARMAGLRDLPRLQADFEVTRQGARGLHVVGRVSAAVGQDCVVTMEPLTNMVEEDIDLVFLPQPPALEQNGDGAKIRGRPDLGADEAEPLVGGVVDLGALATEFLLLGIDPYPRKPDAVFEPPADLEREPGPFAALLQLTKGRDDR